MSTSAPCPPVVNIVGKSDSGKTTLMEALVHALAGRGWRVGTVKHHHIGDLETPGKDSWRHVRAGAASTALVGQDQYAVFKTTGSGPSQDAVIGDLGPVDIVLVEGFKGGTGTRIEVVRSARSSNFTTDAATLFAVVTDLPERAPVGVPVFRLDEGARLAELLERTFLGEDRVEG